jgi:hypothetical protein
VLEKNLGDIEIRTFPNSHWPEQYFCQTTKEAAEIAFNLCNSSVYRRTGLSPIGMAGEKPVLSTHNERMAFVFDNTRVQPSGLACELVVPPEWLSELGADALKNQFVRTPYAVIFRSGDATFILVTLHIDYGEVSTGRVPELKGIARWMSDWANQSNRWHHNLIVLGDFNIDREGDLLWQAFTPTGLTVASDLNLVPRTLFADPNQPTLDKFYDQIAWFQKKSGAIALSMSYNKGGGFDYLPYVYTDTDLSRNSISYRISDHYPLWVEFLI